MSATDDAFTVGDPLPEIRSVQCCPGRFILAVTWKAGGGAVVNLAPDIFTFKAYARLRDDEELFKTAHVVADGAAVAWGSDDGIDMPATAIERLAGEEMSTADFQAFLTAHKLTRDAAAAQLGISRRMVGYYAQGHEIPRYIALACAYLAANAGRVGPVLATPEWTSSRATDLELLSKIALVEVDGIPASALARVISSSLAAQGKATWHGGGEALGVMSLRGPDSPLSGEERPKR